MQLYSQVAVIASVSQSHNAKVKNENVNIDNIENATFVNVNYK